MYLVDERVGFIPFDRQVHIDQHTGIVLARKLLLRSVQLRVQVVNAVAELAVQLHIPVTLEVVHKHEHVDDRHTVIIHVGDQLAVVGVLRRVNRVQEFGRIDVEIDHLRELPRRQFIGQHITVHRLDAGEGCDGFHLIALQKLVDQRLLAVIIPGGDNQRSIVFRTEMLLDHLFGDLRLVLSARLG